MKFNKKWILTLAAGVVLTACGGGGGSGSATSSAQPQQLTTYNNGQINSQSGNTAQTSVQSSAQKPAVPLVQQPAVVPSVPKPAVPLVHKPAVVPSAPKPAAPLVQQPAVVASAPKPAVPLVQKPAVVASAPKPAVPLVQSVQSPPAPTAAAQPNQQSAKSVSFTKVGSINLDENKQTLRLSTFILVDNIGSQPKFDHVSGRQIIQEKREIVLPLAEIPVAELKSGQNADFLIGRSGDLFYGYNHDTQSHILLNEADKFSNYFVIYDESRVNHKVSDGLTATYSKKGGFVYGANGGIKEFEARLNKLGDVSIQFKNGKASGQVTDEATKAIFDISGNTKSLVIAPTANNPVLSVILNERQQKYGQGMERAVIDIKFVDSAQGSGDQKYLLGQAESTLWKGVLVSEKESR